MHNPTQRAFDHSPGRNDTTEITVTTTQNWRTRRGVIFSFRGMALFYKALAYAVDEIGVGRNHARAPHIRGDLSAMVSRMRNHMRQDVIFPALPSFIFAVALAHRLRQVRFGARGKVTLPQL
jgi:hypothetical protein